MLLNLLWLVPAFPLAGTLINGFFGRRLGRRAAGLVASVAVGLSFVTGAAAVAGLLGLPPEQRAFAQVLAPWIQVGTLRAEWGLFLDPLSAVMILVVSGVSFLIHVYAIGYMAEDPDVPRFFTYLNLFVFSMLMLVLADNYLLLYVFWEAVGLCSYLLIGFWYERPAAADAGKKAFIVNRVGDFGFGLGVMLMWTTLGTVRYGEVFAQAGSQMAPGSLLVTVLCLLLFVGATGKSAQLPLYVWLPDAMEGPTPVSALIHAATMVTAGVYMVARSAPLFDLAPAAQGVVAWVGALTAVFAATIACAQVDLKRIIAYSTISQLGYMFIGVGVGAYASAIFHLGTHAFFKSLLFLGAGAVMHALGGELDIRKMGGLRRSLPVTAITFGIGALANAGIFPLAGFWSKDEILAGAFARGAYVPWVLGTTGAFLTAFYMVRVYWLTFEGASRVEERRAHHLHEAPAVMTVPLMILAFFSALGGFAGFPPDGGIYHHVVEPVWRHAEALLSPGAEITLAVISLAAAGAGLYVAYRWYAIFPSLPRQYAERFPGVYRFLWNKYYVDELYQAVIVEPVRRAAVALWQGFDDRIVDGAVNGVGRLVTRSGGTLRLIQSGTVSTYVLSILVGAVALLGYLVFAR